MTDWIAEKLLALPEVSGWAFDVQGLFIERDTPSSVPVSPEGAYLEITEERDLSWRTDSAIDAREVKYLKFRVVGADGEYACYGARLRRVRDPDLETLTRVGAFLSARYGESDPYKWPAKHSELDAQAEARFSEGWERINEGGPAPSTSKEDMEARRAEFDAWHEHVNNAVLALQREAHGPLEIAGRCNGQMSEIAISLFSFSEREREILDKVPDKEARLQIERLIHDERAYAYAFGRWVREGEIIQSHGPLVETAIKVGAEKALGGKNAGEKSAEKADKWRIPALDIARSLRAKDPKASQEAIARQIQDEVAAAPTTVRSITGQISRWENEGKINRRAADK